MAINTELYLPTTSNGWRQQDHNAVTGVTKSASAHSERALFERNRSKGSVFLFVQNAFPCAECHNYFKLQTKNGSISIIFKIMANEGSYSADHGLGLNGSTPRIIYYYKGNSKMVSMSSRGDDAPPIGFPAHPDVEAVE